MGRRRTYYYNIPIITDSLELLVNKEINSSTWVDESGKSNNLTLVNAPSFNMSTPTYFYFNGIDQYAERSNPILSNTSDCSFDIWIKTPSSPLGKDIYLFINGLDGYGSGWNVLMNLNITGYTTTFAVITTSAGISYKSVTSTNQLSLNTWYNYVGVYKQGVGLYLYINGILNNSYLFTDTTLRSSTKGITIGRHSSSSFDSVIVNSFKCYSKALSASEVLQNFNSCKNNFGI